MDTELYPSVIKMADEIMAVLSSETMSLPLEDAARFLESLKNVRRDTLFCFRRGKFADKEILHRHKEWIKVLHRIFLRLLRTIDESLAKIGNFMAQEEGEEEVKSKLILWTSILHVISGCRVLAKMYLNAIDLLTNTLIPREDPLNALIKHTPRNAENHWFLNCADALDSNSKRSLAMMLFPAITDDGPNHDLLINRSQVFDESFNCIGEVDALKLQGGISVKFNDEKAIGPNVINEWFCLLCQSIFSQERGLFSSCPYDRSRYFPNQTSPTDTEHLSYFKFAGRLVGLAMRHEFKLGITIDPTFFSQLGDSDYELELEHIKDSDPVLFRSFTIINEMDDALLNSGVLELIFAREIEEEGTMRTIELGDEGMEPVTSANKDMFLVRFLHTYFFEPVQEQISHFGQGFSDICSKKKFRELLFRNLDLENFDTMMRGSGLKINIEDWKAHTVYDGYTEEDEQIIFFWKIVEGMQEKEKKNLIHFWTNVRFLPVEGFCRLENKLSIHNSFDSGECLPLPRSLPSFCMLLLPPYPSMAVMQKKLQFITQEQFYELLFND